MEYRLKRNQMLRSRWSQILLRFGFWEFKTERDPGNMYEMRSYVLRVNILFCYALMSMFALALFTGSKDQIFYSVYFNFYPFHLLVLNTHECLAVCGYRWMKIGKFCDHVDELGLRM